MVSNRYRTGQAGLTLVETTISVTLLTLVIGIFGVTLSDALASGTAVAGGADVRERGRRALARIKRELAMAGRLDDPTTGLVLPTVFADGAAPAPLDAVGFAHDEVELAQHVAGLATAPAPAGGAPAPYVAPREEIGPTAVREIVFRPTVDQDGDGSIFEAATGVLEWSPELVGFLMRPDGRGGFDLVRRSADAAGAVADEILLRGIEGLTFDLQESRATLPLQAIEVHLHLLDRDSRGRSHRTHLATTITMRNSR